MDRKLSRCSIRSVAVASSATDLHALLYVSDTRLTTRAAEQELRAIVAVSRRNNRRRAITGALMATERHFVQYLEGVQPALNGLLDTLQRDPRHQNLRLLIDGEAAERRFADWSLAYCGPQIVVDPLLDLAMREGIYGARARNDLINMMAVFAGASLRSDDVGG